MSGAESESPKTGRGGQRTARGGQAQPAEQRCLLCRQPATPAAGGSMLCELRADRLHLLGALCAACSERLRNKQEEEEQEATDGDRREQKGQHSATD